ncbi:hypothetical protein TBLA_0B08990 [Henningerozyma blattae CBS 6284]|uniref:SRP9 domain-containing protein n=1 Tax=Henningerozyma blattae (strain ATCC 34711 / CBS 6284 / DSM 70876 / NBRC 10599 / NRRL Y-10934 / UCD 77-7) TaxID=1071380 RepID=I2H012_HENB6|nr:hypothetical protein TBLA_0B08990 [Tetrapisispora blattae CBS 6284]CCH59714.1 hypothetical protein TBLA_0B08990 [Tetrapisispora blattae CBS 6284]
MSVKPIDTYIQDSVRLFQVSPSTSTITITYKTKKDKLNKKEKETDEQIKSTKTQPVNSVSFVTTNNQTSTHYSFETRKTKDVSRLLSALGPRGVTINLTKLEKKIKF